MKKRHILIGIILLGLMVVLGGCSGETKQITYSNLIDQTTQNKIGNMLMANGVTREEVDTFLAQVNDYNNLMGDMSTAKNGFVQLKANSVPYNGAHVIETWAKAERSYGDLNGRITAFELCKEFIQCNNKEEIIQDISLLFDFNIMDSHPLAGVKKEDRSKFIHLYESVPAILGLEPNDYEEMITNAWEQRGLSFLNTSDMTMINSFVYNQDTSELFVGLAGVLIDTEGSFVYIEKYAPLFPYQVTKFRNRKEVVSYLMGRLQNEYGDANKPFIIMENSNIMGS